MDFIQYNYPTNRNEKTLIIDLDGVLCENWTIADLVSGENGRKKDFPAFFKESVKCPPNEIIMGIMYAASLASWNIELWTARPANFSDVTIEWLRKNSLFDLFDTIRMRDPKDFSSSAITKERWLFHFRGMYDKFPFLAIDDREEVIDMYRKHGVGAFHFRPYERRVMA